jgi:Ion channel
MGSFRAEGRSIASWHEPINAVFPDEEAWNRPPLVVTPIRIPVVVPLAVGAIPTVSTILIHALAVMATVSFVRRERRLGRAGVNFWNDLGIVTLAISFALAAHLVDIALWAVLFRICGEFSGLGTAYYHSAVNYTTLGYGDLLLTPSWRMLGPLEAADGMLMFGVSTAIIFALTQRLLQDRFVDLKQ